MRSVITPAWWAGPPFSPADIAGLELWLKADALSLNDGDPVTTWTRSDTSGNGGNPTQATAAKKPTFKTAILNGKPVVRFDGTDDYLEDTGISVVQPDTVFAVAKNISGDSLGHNVFDGVTTRQAIATDASASHFISLYAGTAVVASAIQWGTTNFHYITATFNGASTALRVDGSGTAIGNPGAATLAGLRVGTFDGTAGNWNGDTAELLVYSGALSAGDIASVEGYLTAKYGL